MELPVPGASPVTFGLSVNTQLYVVPFGTMVVGGLFTGVTVKDDPEQMVAVCAGTIGNGRTVIVLVRISEPQSMLEASTPTVYVPGVENKTVMDELPLTTGKLPRFPNVPLVTE